MSYAMTSYGRSKLFRAPMARYGAIDPRTVAQTKNSAAVVVSGVVAGAGMEYLRGLHGDKYYELGAAGQTVDAEIVVGALALIGAAFLPTSQYKLLGLSLNKIPPSILEGAAAGLFATSLGRAARRKGEEMRAKSAGGSDKSE